VPGIWDRLKAAMSGDAGDGELGRDDLLRQIVDGIGALSRFGARGKRSFPEEVRVTVTVAEGGTQTVEAFLQAPAFERELEARLENAHPDRDGSFPVRGYTVVAGPANRVEVTETRRSSVVLQLEGGDRDGARTPAPAGRKTLYAGRGAWHGPGQDLRNDVVLTESLPWVPRRAFRLERRGTVLVVHPLDGGDMVEVVKADGARTRPARMPHGTAELRVGDHLELRAHESAVLIVRMVKEEA
jgi:hypothetical protein